MNILIFSHQIEGHHIEYLHHLYEEAIKNTENNYVFLTSKRYNELKGNYHWMPALNVRFVFLTDKEQEKADIHSQIKAAWYMSYILRKYVKNYKIDRIFLIWFIGMMPFLPMFINRNVVISGILYRIYLYHVNHLSYIRRVLERCRYWIIVHSPNIKSICVLNDEYGTKELNKHHATNKFIYLPDPLPQIDCTRLKNIRENLSVSENQCVYLHFGALEERKGTLEILKAIMEMEESSLKNKVFIFAGIVGKSIKEEFYRMVEIALRRTNIIVFDDFCTNELLFNLCYSCDCILIPYTNTIQSSGVLGYASFFRKPVIGPKRDLLGRLIADNKLGMAIDDVSAKGLKNALCKELSICSSQYASNHKIEDFNRIIFNQLV